MMQPLFKYTSRKKVLRLPSSINGKLSQVKPDLIKNPQLHFVLTHNDHVTMFLLVLFVFIHAPLVSQTKASLFVDRDSWISAVLDKYRPSSELQEKRTSQ